MVEFNDLNRYLLEVKNGWMHVDCKSCHEFSENQTIQNDAEELALLKNGLIAA